jgi:hypothetical protein
VLPICTFLLVFQVGVLRAPVSQAGSVVLGIVFVLIGLTLFLRGLKLGLVPLGENVGSTLPLRAPLWVMIPFALLVGYGATLAEPALSSLKFASGEAEVASLENPLFTHMVGLGVGLAVVVGLFRILYLQSLLKFILPVLLLLVVLSLFAPREYLAVAWDAGGVTTGPVTVPLILALGVGLATITARGRPEMKGFGLITLASLFPILMVLLLGLFSRS